MPSEPAVVHRLMVNADALAIMAEAIKVLSLQREKFQRLKDVVDSGLERIDPKTGVLPAPFTEHGMEGAIPVLLRLPKKTNESLDSFRNELCDRMGDHCGVREAVVFCALHIALE